MTQKWNDVLPNSDGVCKIAALSANEMVRMMHVFSEPQMQAAVRKIVSISPRDTLDAACSRGSTPIREGYQGIANLFNDLSYKPHNILEDDVELSHFRPELIECRRGSDSSKATFGTLRSKYTEAWNRFNRSGFHDAEFLTFVRATRFCFTFCIFSRVQNGWPLLSLAISRKHSFEHSW